MSDSLINKISEESGDSIDDVRAQVENKMEELSGLVSEEGAAHLVAKEKGVNLGQSAVGELAVANIVPGMRRVDVKAKVVDVTDLNTFTRKDGEEGRVQNLVLGDSSGTVRMSLWDEQTELTDKVDVGDSLHIQGAYSREDNRGNPELRIGESTRIEVIDEDIGDVNMEARSRGSSYDRVKVSEVVNENMNYEVAGTVLQVYTDNPFYMACPECNKKVTEEGDGYECKEHGAVDAQHNLILSAVIDDGYGNIRTVFFRDRARDLLGVEEQLNGDVERVQALGRDMTGNTVVVQGRSRYNDFFDRIELIGDDVRVVDEQILLEEKIVEVQPDE